MLERKMGTSLLLCILPFLLGCAAGSLTGFFCTDSAVLRIQSFVVDWYSNNGALRCLTSEVIFSLLFLLCSVSVTGYFVIPALDSILGYGISLTAFCLLWPSADFGFFVVLAPAALSVLPLLRISELSIGVSLSIARMWRSNGIRSFDLRSILTPLWSSLLMLFLLLPLRLYLLYYI